MTTIPLNKDEVTKEWVQQVLDSAKEGVVVDDVGVEEDEQIVTGFSAEILRLNVTGSKDGRPWEGDYVLKLMPTEETSRKFIVEHKVFHKEVEAYTKIIPYMISVQETPNKLQPDVPRCLFAKTDKENNGIIVLEDLQQLGFQLPDMKYGLDVDHCKLLLKSLAKFHALGYKCRFTSKEPLLTKFQCLEHFIFSEAKDHWNPGLKSIPKVLDALEKGHYERKNILKHMRDNLQSVFEKASTHDSRKGLYHTICHGDMWCNNVLYKYARNRIPVNSAIFDFQFCYFGVPPRDLGYLFCLSTSGDLRKRHLKELLKFYRKELLADLSTLGVSQVKEKDFSFEKLWKMYYKTIHLGFFHALYSLPIMMMPEKMKVTSEELVGLSLEEAEELYSERAAEAVLKDRAIAKRLFDLIEEMMENDVI